MIHKIEKESKENNLLFIDKNKKICQYYNDFKF